MEIVIKIKEMTAITVFVVVGGAVGLFVGTFIAFQSGLYSMGDIGIRTAQLIITVLGIAGVLGGLYISLKIDDILDYIREYRNNKREMIPAKK